MPGLYPDSWVHCSIACLRDPDSLPGITDTLTLVRLRGTIPDGVDCEPTTGFGCHRTLGLAHGPAVLLLYAQLYWAPARPRPGAGIERLCAGTAACNKQGSRETKKLLTTRVFSGQAWLYKPVLTVVVEQRVWGILCGLRLCLSPCFFLLLLGTYWSWTLGPPAFPPLTACIKQSRSAVSGEVSAHYGKSSRPRWKWCLNFAMLLGRLEVFTLLVLFTPMFWRRLRHA